MNLALRLATLLVASAWLGGAWARADEVLTNDELGNIGLMLALRKGAEFPSVIRVYPGSPATKGSYFEDEDQIIAICLEGPEGTFASLNGTSPERVASLFKAAQSSTIWVKTRRRNGNDQVTPLTHLPLRPEPMAGEGDAGSVGLLIARRTGEEFPTVTAVYSDSPVATEGTLRAGDQLMSISLAGWDGPFVPLKDMTLTEVAGLLRGEHGSKVWVWAKVEKAGVGRVESLVALQRFQFPTGRRIDFVINGFSKTNFISTLQHLHRDRGTGINWLLPLSYDRSARLPALLGADWLAVTNGISGAAVVMAKGEPPIRLVEIGFDEETWMYRHHGSIPGATTNKTMVYLRLNHGVVREMDLFELP